MRPWSQALQREVDAAALEAGWQRVRARRRRPRALRHAPLAAAVAALAAILFLWLRPPAAPAEVGALAVAGSVPLPVEWESGTGATIALDDGSRVELAADSRLRTRSSDAAHVELALEHGRATFDVKPGGPRAWGIDAGPVVVRVLGTRFTVERDGDVVDVSVERGKVLVEGDGVPGGSRVLLAGDAIRVEPPSLPVDALPAAAPPPEAALAPEAPLPPGAPALTPDPPAATAPAEPAPAEPDPMSRADAARREGRPREALTLLEAVVEQGSARSPLAAFTAAKIHAEDMGDPAAAGPWFLRAVDLGLPSGLDEEALARAVECFAKAGKKAEARRAAARYGARFPGGHHHERVRSWARD
jgi:transmembrane sensor